MTSTWPLLAAQLQHSKLRYEQAGNRDIWHRHRSGVRIEIYSHSVFINTPTEAYVYRWASERSNETYPYICTKFNKTHDTISESSCQTRKNLEIMASTDLAVLLLQLHIEKAENKNQLLACSVCTEPLAGTYIACGCAKHAYCSKECCESDVDAHIDVNLRRLFRRGKGKANMRIYAQAIYGEFADAADYERRLNEACGRLIADLPPELMNDGRLHYAAFNRAIRVFMFDPHKQDTLDNEVLPLIRLYQSVNQLSLQRRSQEVAWNNFVIAIRNYISLVHMAVTTQSTAFVDKRPAAGVAVFNAAVRLGDVLDGHRLKKVSSGRMRPTPGRTTEGPFGKL